VSSLANVVRPHEANANPPTPNSTASGTERKISMLNKLELRCAAYATIKKNNPQIGGGMRKTKFGGGADVVMGFRIYSGS